MYNILHLDLNTYQLLNSNINRLNNNTAPAQVLAPVFELLIGIGIS